MTAETFWIAVAGASCVVNLGMVAYYWVLIRRQWRLDTLLEFLCIQAFMEHHIPIWTAWSRAYGYDFKINVRPIAKRLKDLDFD